MITRFISALLVVSGALLAAQTSAPVPGVVAHPNDLGFSYSLPADWEVKDMAPAVPLMHQQLEKDATASDEKKAASCVQIPLMATHGMPRSVVEVVTIAFDCFGQQFVDKDLPGFGMGVAGGLKKSFTISDPLYGAYSIGAHSVWIERATGTLISRPEMKYTVETVCSLLKKGAVCWTAMAVDDAALHTFEQGAVELDGERSPVLVPANAFPKQP